MLHLIHGKGSRFEVVRAIRTLILVYSMVAKLSRMELNKLHGTQYQALVLGERLSKNLILGFWERLSFEESGESVELRI